MNTHDEFMRRYPHGVLTEQEGGVPNDAENWQAATHVCRKHRETEWTCRDAAPDEFAIFAAAFAAEDYRFNLVRDAVGEDFDDLDDEPAPEPDEPECDGRCLTAADIGLPEYGSSMYAVDPDCSLHGDGISKPPPPSPEPARHITTIAGQRVPLIDPYGDFSWDAP